MPGASGADSIAKWHDFQGVLMVEQLLPWVEQELRQFRRRAGKLAGRYPRVAGRLAAGRESAVMRDPHVDRLVQAVAVLHARIAHSLDRAGPQLDEVLLEALFPGFLRPAASCAIFRMATDAPCGMPLAASGVDGRRHALRLTAAAVAGPLALEGLCWRPYAGPGQEHLLSLSLAGHVATPEPEPAPGPGPGPQWVPGPGAMPGPGGRSTVRLYVSAEPALRAALQDALLMHASRAWAETPGGGMAPLSAVPLRVAGFEEAGEHGWQVLREYQCFPERFNFLELDLAALPCCERVALHIAVPVRADSELARTLARADAANLLTLCAPAVNLFPAAAAPIDVTGLASEYGLVAADPAHVIWSIDSVHLLQGRSLSELVSPQAARFGDLPDARRATWTARRALPVDGGPAMRISFEPTAASAPTASALTATARGAGVPVQAGALDGDGAVAAGVPVPVTASVGLTCCDRVVPAGLVAVEPQAVAVSTPTRMREVAAGRALRWRLLTMLALEARTPDLESLRLALSLQDLGDSESAQKLQAALTDVRSVSARLPMRHRHGTASINGTEVRITIEESALVGSSIAVFVHVLDQYLSHSVHLNSFMQLVAISAGTGKELMRCRPRNGNLFL